MPKQVVHIQDSLDQRDYRRDYPRFPYEIGSLRFSIDDAARADWLAAASDFAQPFDTTVPWERRILYMREPSGYFPPEFVNQFGHLVSPPAITGYRGRRHLSHPAIPAYFGRGHQKDPGWDLDYEALVALVPPEKRNAISVVMTTKTSLPGHRRRLRFLRRLQRALGNRLEVFGRGFRVVTEKAEVILPCQYHLVLENTIMPAYWTEKLADAYLGYAFPIVSGPPDLNRWFSPDSFEAIDISEPDAAIERILHVMDNDTYHQRIDAVRRARDKLMHEERLCHVLARVITAEPNSAPGLTVPETLFPVPRLGGLPRIRREIVRSYWRIDDRIRSLLMPGNRPR